MPRPPCACSARRRCRRSEPQAAAPSRRRGAGLAAQHRRPARQKVYTRPPDQPRLQGRRPAGHLPALRRHQRAERRREPRRVRQGHAEAERGAVGPGAGPDPEGQRPRLHARGQRHPHRPAQPTCSRKEQDRRKLDEEKALAGDLAGLSKPPPTPRPRSCSRPVKKVALSARGTDHHRRAHQHDDHHRPAAEPREGAGT